MPTTKQDQDFTRHVFEQNNFLETAIEWIKDNINPEDVYTSTQLAQWAESEGYIKQIDSE